MKYKAGDKVRCVKSTLAVGVNVGDVYTVKGFSHNSEFGTHIELQEVRSTPTECVFESVEANPKFKVGDKVRCIGKSCAAGVEVGSIYTVKNPRLFASKVHEGVYCMELLEVGSAPYDMHFELVQEDAVLAPEEVFEHLRKGTKLQYRRTVASKWVEYITGSRVASNPSFRMITEGQWRIKPEPEVIELNGKKYREIID